ncbi:MAG: DNA polymerase III subunit delta' [Chloroflexaceae bacterium]|nr:DNA polymerase III subunit delta' [Chloroflexaceae bacterium]
MTWGIIGHEWAVEQLRASIRSGADAHAYLFSGPPGLGKRLLALRTAQALNCEQGAGDPCLACRACRRIERGNHPDVRVASMESQAAAGKAEEAARQKELKIATIREWQRDITLRPYEAQRRVLILHDAERLSEEAANAMLKTLEEPPLYATLILVADSNDLLPTIVSRCRVLRLRPLPRRQVVAALVGRGADPDTAALLAAWSGGRIGQALQLLETPEAIARRHEYLGALLAIHEQGRSEGMRWAQQRAKEYRSGEQESVFAWLELWQSWWRDVLLVAAGSSEGVVNINRRADLERIAQRHPLPQIYAFVTQLGHAAQQLRENANPNLVLENLALHAPGA